MATLLVAFYAAIIVTRRPDILSQPQFYAEDGQAWFADAHNSSPWQALITPIGGYFTFFQRFIALLFTPLGLSKGALAFAAVAICMQILPPLMFASSRLRPVVASDRLRCVIGAVYLLIPNAELTGVLTNTQWHLAVLAFIVLLAERPRSRAGAIVDLTILGVAGLTGPYALFLAPLGLLMHRRHLDSWRKTEVAILGAAALVQIGVLLASLHGAPRSVAPLGLSLPDLFRIVANQMLARFGRWGIAATAVPLAGAVAAAICVVIAAGMQRGPSGLRYFVVFSVAIVMSGLFLPYGHVPNGSSAWAAMATGGSSNRYFFLLAVALVLSALAVVSPRKRTRRQLHWGPALVVGALVVCAITQWQYPSSPPQYLDRYQATLDRAPTGTVITIPLYPAGWRMQLTAR